MKFSGAGWRFWRWGLIMFRRFVFVFVMVVSSSALANGGIVDYVAQVRVDKSGLGMVIFKSNLSNSPPCALTPGGGMPYALAFDANTAGGRAIQAMATAAMLAGKKIEGNGTGFCTIYGGAWAEDWSYGLIRSNS